MPDSLQVHNDTVSFSILDYSLFLEKQDSLKTNEIETLSCFRFEDVFSVVEQNTILRESIFTQHQLPKRSELRPTPQKDNSDVWVFGTLIGVAILFCWILGVYRTRASQMLRACFSNRYMSILMREGNILTEIIILPVTTIFLSLTTLLIYKLINDYSYIVFWNKIPDYFLFILILCSLFTLTFLKFLAIRFIGNIFKLPNASVLYVVNDIIFAFITSILLFPLVFIVFFSDIGLPYFDTIFTLSIIATLYLFKVIRGFFLILTASQFSKLYLFYYLCSVEIFPILIIGKLLIFSKS